MEANDNMGTEDLKGVSKKTWTLIVIVAIAILLGLLARGVKKNNVYKEGHTTFKSLDATFSVDYPRTWEVQVGNRGAIEATFVNKEQIQANGKISYIHIAKGVIGSSTLEEAYTEALNKYSSLFKKMNIIAQQDKTIDGVPAKMVVFDGTLGGKSMSYAIVVFVKNGVTYVATASGSADSSKELQKELNTMLSSWKFTSTTTSNPSSQNINTGETGKVDLVTGETGKIDVNTGRLAEPKILPTGDTN